MSIQENSYYIHVAAYINACIEMLESMIQLNRLGNYQTFYVKSQSQAIGSAVTCFKIVSFHYILGGVTLATSYSRKAHL